VVAIGPHCGVPHTCPLEDDCWSFLPPASVFDLVGGGRRSFELLAAGYRDLADVPFEFDLDDRQRLQLEAVRSGRPHVDRAALRQFLGDLSFPVFYFDLETVAPAVPIFEGTRPYEPIPFLFSIHRQEAPGEPARHFTYQLDGAADPRADFMRAARVSLETRGSIVSYNAAFEMRVLAGTAAWLGDDFPSWFAALEPRFVDLLAPFCRFAFYHPGQGKSTSLKAVLGPLTGTSYDDLAFGDGEAASVAYLRILKGGTGREESQRILRELEAYCSQDTGGMVAIVKELTSLAELAGAP
jgi:hypothetical protein